jgi:benzoyl-CoA reductase/2-hydroxyglutaryl-CoA dehydratase subunit BcrC/BadD/HgdB
MSLKTLDKIRQALRQRPQQLVEAKEKGAKVVGYFCCNIPEEILLALDLIPVRLGTGGDEQLVNLGGQYISTQNCVFVRQSVGLFAKGEDPYVQNSDLVAIAGTCIQIYRMGEIIEHYFKTPIKILGIPRNFELPEGQEYFRKELESFSGALEEFAGKKIEKNGLAESVKLLADIRGAIQELYRLQVDSDVIGWRDVFETVNAGFFLDRREYLILLNELIGEVKSGILHQVRDHQPRIFISGSIIATGDTKIIDLIEQTGGRVVGDDLCSGLRPYKGLVVKEPTLAAVADAYLARVPCASLPNLALEGDRRVENLLESIRSSGAEGVVYHTLRYCDPFTFKAAETKRLLGRDTPFLEIHTEYARSDIEAIRTRLRAFMEVLNGQHKKREVV